MNAKTVTVSRLPEEALNKLDERIGLIWREEVNGELEELIPDEQMTTFNQLLIGYDSAWDEIDRIRKKQETINELYVRTKYKYLEQCEVNDRLRYALENAEWKLEDNRSDLICAVQDTLEIIREALAKGEDQKGE
ncbi:hypothetical protein GCM10010451_68410 [Streptomyces virens]|uniref:Uncharacterized protein n=1 Tax=Streptomyces virens TaxID=285572 RepID=A0ABP6HKF1_9ACTN